MPERLRRTALSPNRVQRSAPAWRMDWLAARRRAAGVTASGLDRAALARSLAVAARPDVLRSIATSVVDVVRPAIHLIKRHVAGDFVGAVASSSGRRATLAETARAGQDGRRTTRLSLGTCKALQVRRICGFLSLAPLQLGRCRGMDDSRVASLGYLIGPTRVRLERWDTIGTDTLVDMLCGCGKAQQRKQRDHDSHGYPSPVAGEVTRAVVASAAVGLVGALYSARQCPTSCSQ